MSKTPTHSHLFSKVINPRTSPFFSVILMIKSSLDISCISMVNPDSSFDTHTRNFQIPHEIGFWHSYIYVCVYIYIYTHTHTHTHTHTQKHVQSGRKKSTLFLNRVSIFVFTGVKCIMASACRLIRMSDRETKLHVRWPHTFYSLTTHNGNQQITKQFYGRLRRGPKAWRYSLDKLTTTATPKPPPHLETK